MFTVAIVVLLSIAVFLTVRFLHRRRVRPSAIAVAPAPIQPMPVNTEVGADDRSVMMSNNKSSSVVDYIKEIFLNNLMPLSARQVQYRLRFWGVCLPINKVGRTLEYLANGPGTLNAQRRYVVGGKRISPSKRRKATRYTLAL